MNKSDISSPTNTLSTNDSGDDTQRRYRYQAFYAAIISLELLNEATEFEEIFCEHHEDVLIRKKNGKFIGIQVKTRNYGQEPFKADDKQIINSLYRFVEQDIEFPNFYEKFIIATNYTFWAVKKKNSRNLSYLLSLAQDAYVEKPARLHLGLSKCVKQIQELLEKKGFAKIDNYFILNVLQKVHLQESLPKFDDLESRLAQQIPEFYEVNEAGLDDLLYAARGLISQMLEASSLQHVSARSMYFALFSNPEQMEIDEIIEGKRINGVIVRRVLQDRLTDHASLSTRNPIPIENLPKGIRKTELKMGAGKISANNIRGAKDHKYATELLLDKWIHKHGVPKASKRFDQLKLIISNECREIYDQKYSENNPFGREMLIEVRNRLRARIESEPNLFFGCRYEHLLGVASILTEMCEVWWSKEFEIPSETAS